MKEIINQILFIALLLGLLVFGIKTGQDIDKLKTHADITSEMVNDLKKSTDELSARINEQPKKYVIVIPEKTNFPEHDIPLDEKLQEFTFKTCEKNGLEYELALAVMNIESRFDEKAVSYTNDYGLMGLNLSAQQLTFKQALDPYFNIERGVKILSNLNLKYDDYNGVLMAYNMGETGAKRAFDRGITTTDYSRKVLNKYNEYKNCAKEDKNERN